MPKRIDHKFKNEVELKWCSLCKNWLELNNFHRNGNKTWDGFFYCCKDCSNKKRMNNPQYLASETYRKMKDRCKNDSAYKKRKTKVLIARKDFVKWYVKRWFKGCLVDRIDNLGHYEKNNIQLLTLTEHNIKHRQDNLNELGVIENDGERYCYKCATLKSYSDFGKKLNKVSKSNPLGLKEECKSCARKARNKRYKEIKNDIKIPKNYRQIYHTHLKRA